MSYLDIAIANEQIKPTTIKGKEYSEVNQRIKAFRINHPYGSIATKIESLQDGVVVMSCEVKDELGNLLGKAYAYEKEDSNFINQTSFIENCCTSATGRALGYAGYGIDVSVASAEEVANAINNQEPTKEEALEYTLPYGKYKGKKLTEVPEEYIDWMLGNNTDTRLIKLIELATGKTIPSEEDQQEKLRLLVELDTMIQLKGIDRENMYKHYKVTSDKDMTIEQLREAVKKLG